MFLYLLLIHNNDDVKLKKGSKNTISLTYLNPPNPLNIPLVTNLETFLEINKLEQEECSIQKRLRLYHNVAAGVPNARTRRYENAE